MCFFLRVLYSVLICLAVMSIVILFFVFSYNKNSDITFVYFNSVTISVSLFILLLLLIVLLMYKKYDLIYESFASVLISFFILYSINITFVTNIERSLSVNMLALIANAENGLPIPYLEKKANHFILNNGGFQQRLEEQRHIKAIIITDNKVYLTDKGRFIYKLLCAVGDFFQIKKDNYKEIPHE